MTDGELIKQYRNGDESAFETLYHKYRKPLYSYLNSILPGQPEAADDLYQQVWMRILKQMHRYRERQKFISWAFRIAHNLAVDYFRAGKRRDEVLTDAPNGADTAPAPDGRLQQRELREALETAVSELPVEQREVFLLRRDGVPFKEIARIQSTSVNTALGRMRYAINNLRATLYDWS